MLYEVITRPDGVFLSNGPGDPEPCGYAIDAIKTIVEQGRITSYNVCYTKLLRKTAEQDGDETG